MGAVKTANPPPSPETIWAILQEVAKSQKETDRQMKETDKKLGKLGNRFGEVIEYMIAPNLCKKFNEFGFVFEKSNNGTVEFTPISTHS